MELMPARFWSSGQLMQGTAGMVFTRQGSALENRAWGGIFHSWNKKKRTSYWCHLSLLLIWNNKCEQQGVKDQTPDQDLNQANAGLWCPQHPQGAGALNHYRTWFWTERAGSLGTTTPKPAIHTHTHTPHTHALHTHTYTDIYSHHTHTTYSLHARTHTHTPQTIANTTHTEVTDWRSPCSNELTN